MITAHLDLVHAIAKKKVPNSLTADDVATMDETEILALFVNEEAAAARFAADRSKAAKFRASLAGVTKSCGTELDDSYTYMLDSSSEAVEEVEEVEELEELEELEEEEEKEEEAAPPAPRALRARTRALLSEVR